MRILLSLCVGLIFCTSTYAQSVNKISVHRESQALIKGKKITEHAVCFYNSENLKMVVHSLKPLEYYKIIKNTGEVKMYFPKTNELFLQQSELLSSSKEELYLYVNNMYDDLGLRAEGFTMKNTRYEGEYMIVEWSPPASYADKILKMEIVFENMIPIYSAAFNIKGDVYKKTYYTDYLINNNLILPKRITDITYTSKTDSIVRRILYTDIKINEIADDSFEHFKIPNDANLVK